APALALPGYSASLADGNQRARLALFHSTGPLGLRGPGVCAVHLVDSVDSLDVLFSPVRADTPGSPRSPAGSVGRRRTAPHGGYGRLVGDQFYLALESQAPGGPRRRYDPGFGAH